MYLKINTELYCCSSKDEAELLFCWIDVTRWKYLLENMLEEVESSRHIYFSIIHKSLKIRQYMAKASIITKSFS